MKKPQLFLLHFAGGNCYSFQFMIPRLTGFNVVPLELPGRGRRMNEDLLRDFDLAALDIQRQLVNKLASPDFMIYGHSMGAYLALRVSALLEQQGKYPACLVVSGNAGPGMGEKRNTYLLEHEAFLHKLESLGGMSPELKDNPELYAFFEPILRADFEIAENHRLTEDHAVNASLFAMMGSKEEHVADIGNWSRFTRSEFDYEVLEGDHFFIHRHAEKVSGIINNFFSRSNMKNEKYQC